jgi:membrane protein implicated in regulation of membrane protease activity
VGEEGEIRRNGYVFVDGELWRARTADGEALVPGQRVRVASVDDGLELVVVGSRDTEERG